MGLGPVGDRNRTTTSSPGAASGVGQAGPASNVASTQAPAGPSAPAHAADGYAAARGADQGSSIPYSAQVPTTLRRRPAGAEAQPLAAPVRAAAPQAAVSPTQPLSVTDPAQRQKLIEGSPQVNKLSQELGNSQSVCAGAAMTNAILMDCKSPEDAKRNADAIQKLADNMKAWDHLPDGLDQGKVQEAIDNLGKGKLSPENAQHLQQLLYSMAQQVQGGSKDGLVDPTGMGTMVGLLQGAGAFKSSSPQFHETALPGGGNHWTVTVDGQHANSEPAKVGQGPPDEMVLDSQNPKARAGINLSQGPPPSTEVLWRQQPGGGLPPTKDGQAYRVELDRSKLDPAQLRRLFQSPETIRLGHTTVQR
jgi:hypothetical protein